MSRGDGGFLAILSISAATVSFLFGELDTLFFILVSLMVIEYYTGSFVEYYKKKLKVRFIINKIFGKITILSLVSVAHFLDYFFQTSLVIRDATIIFLYLL
ncbi:phage holin family protein [Bacillus carboniphilus]|uniref:Phage holin family protein n=1 Tax=Bacillus carboniphilus TaxID=86663 RepID=A0ABY9JR42_9BACI|nr:phage holin family protein [Bacillus carboniphilus]WLR41183.1 phage holin family protein [Bacillus carboniphilus]